MATKVDIAAAERVLKRAVAKALTRLATYDDLKAATDDNKWTFIVAIDAATLLTEERAA